MRVRSHTKGCAVYARPWRAPVGATFERMAAEPPCAPALECGLVKRDSLPDIDVGYALLPQFRGAGYAREAAAACLDYGANVLGLERILAITRPENRSSISVLESLGMRLERTEQLAGDDHVSMVFEWRPAARAVVSARPTRAC